MDHIRLVDYRTMRSMLEGEECDVGVDVFACGACGDVHIYLGEDGQEPQYRLDVTVDYARVMVRDMMMAIAEIDTGMHLRDEQMEVH